MKKIASILFYVAFCLFTGVRCQERQKSGVNQFLTWHSQAAQKNLGVSTDFSKRLVSKNLLKLDTLSPEMVERFKLEPFFSKADLDTINKQIKFWNDKSYWNSRIYNLPLFDPDTLRNTSQQYHEFSVPIFSKDRKYCLFRSNISCKENYCHKNLYAIYQQEPNNQWKMVKIISQLSF
ncbi:hypothetical protein [Flavobacterium sp.]|uniref:hypothetical protein n=1 Tax=Flavobacterium sp. TaxID=239 RepID=UPI002601F5E4|nr:hypothetical protein [Flavobacterium sp.]